VRASRFARAIAGALLAAAAAAAHADASVAWLRDSEMQARKLHGAGMPQLVPVGSLWKLFMYAHLVDSHATEPAYTCAKQVRAANDPEQYCCKPGESIGRDAALARSCGAYFEAAHLGTWANVRPGAPAQGWREDTRVSVRAILDALDALSPAAKAEARRALLETSLSGYGRDAWPVLGTGLRYKTWTMPDPARRGASIGGAAGWLADGTPFWFGANGSSRQALRTHATTLAAALPAPKQVADTQASCVEVDFFSRYPIKAVLRDGDGSHAPAGALQGSYRIGFENGNWLRITARGDLQLETDGAPRIHGRFTLNEYIARVLDREADAGETMAARAFAIAARSYLVQNAAHEAGCWRIADASRTQRVSPNPPGAKAMAAALFTDELVLEGAPVRYHRDQSGLNRLAWKEAVALSREGLSFERILARAYPKATLAGLNGREECRRMADAEAWLARAAASWRRKLAAEPGYEHVSEPVRVCALAEGHPYADQSRLRIYARDWRTREGRLTLTHEYLHLAFRFHPNAHDEQYIERLARRLMDG
jgi:uncharacterized protein YfaQ (DUF2300 family)